MSSSLTIALLIGLALVLANLPFITEPMFAVLRLSKTKGLGLRLIELFAYFLVCGLVGRAMESQAGQVAAQTWEFYATGAAMFLTLAFPGFVYRYLWKRHT